MEGSLTVAASIRHVKTTQIIVHQIDVIYSRNILDNGHKLLIHKQTSGIFFRAMQPEYNHYHVIESIVRVV